MKLPPDVEFHEDIRLLVYRPSGSIDEAAINKITSVIEDLEAATQEPFNRFSDTSEAHEVELNFRYVIHVSLVGVGSGWEIFCLGGWSLRGGSRLAGGGVVGGRRGGKAEGAKK